MFFQVEAESLIVATNTSTSAAPILMTNVANLHFQIRNLDDDLLELVVLPGICSTFDDGKSSVVLNDELESCTRH